MPLQVVQAKATTSKPRCCSSPSRFASARWPLYGLGARRQRRFGPRACASSPSGWRWRNQQALVQPPYCVGCWYAGTAGDGRNDDRAVWHFTRLSLLPGLQRFRGSASSRFRRATARAGLTGWARLRPTVERSNLSTRSYSASVSVGLDQ